MPSSDGDPESEVLSPSIYDTVQWRKVQFLVENGFRFYAVYETLVGGERQRVRYPKTLAEARDFVATYRPSE